MMDAGSSGKRPLFDRRLPSGTRCLGRLARHPDTELAPAIKHLKDAIAAGWA